MPTNHWKEALKRISLMGLNATEITPELKTFFKTHEIKGNPLQQVLAGISLLSLQERAHFSFRKTTKKPSPFSKEHRYISQYQYGQLAQILNKDFQWAMYEFITIIRAQKRLVPAFLIPDLIDYGLSETWFKPWIEELTGLQGAWALSHIPAWEKRYGQIQSGHWQIPKSIEKKVFPLLNLRTPLPNLTHIVPYLEFPSPLWSLKFSQKIHEYIHSCIKLPNIDIHTQSDIEDLIHFASYLTDSQSPIYWKEDDYNETWTTLLLRYNQVLRFRIDLSLSTDEDQKGLPITV